MSESESQPLPIPPAPVLRERTEDLGRQIAEHLGKGDGG